jgi:hypothetical protein
MDATKLHVGQQVVMENGPLGGLGTVVSVGASGVVVRIDIATGPMPENSLIQFYAQGKVQDSRHLGYHGPTNDHGLPRSFECDTPWELTDGTVAGFWRANRGRER